MKRKTFSEKHGIDATPDSVIQRALDRRIKQGKLSCASAFAVGKELGVSLSAVGRTADLLGLRIVKCQLGLFGYYPRKSIVPPSDSIPPELENAIRSRIENDCLPCRCAWIIADELKIRKIQVSAACDSLGVKIKPCQIGAF